MPNQIDIFIENPSERKCQCEPNCSVSLMGYRKNCKIFPPHRAKYDHRLREQKREATREFRYESAREYHEAHPEFMERMKRKLKRQIPPFRFIWEHSKWHGNFHPNDHWQGWYKKQLQEWKLELKTEWKSRRDR